ncbi:MAG: NAD-dependent epimerase/dehydratase family protein, partial [Candidatus Hodarchaeales archaeon]
MRIFITGGTGFIGPYVVDHLLKKGHKLLLLSYEEETLNENLLQRMRKVEFVSGTLENLPKWKKSLISFNPELTIHMAWQGIPDFKSEMSVKNLQNGLDLYLTLAEIGCKRIITSGSCWEYGRTEGKISEELTPFPSNPFTIAKNSLRVMGEEIAKEKDLQFIWTRFFYVYGPGQKPTSLLPYIITSVLSKVTPQIKTPDARNDFIFVDDVGSAIASIVGKCQGKNIIYNIGSGYSTSVREIIKIAYEKNNIPFSQDLFPTAQESDKVNFWADISKIKADIGWEPKVSLDEGIE